MRKVISILLFFSCLAVQGQGDTAFRLIKTIKADVIDFAVDNLDNIYLFSSSNQLKKLNASGDSVAVYNDVKKYGKATYIDVSNPLRVLLYYPNFLTIVVLDRLLNIRSVIDLRKANILQVNAIGLSYDNNIWLYDESNSKLKKIDDQGRVLLETPDFRQLFGDAPSPQSIADRDGFVYMYDSIKGVYVFDYYGALKNKILITGWKDFRVAGKYIYGMISDTLQRYQINTFRTDYQKLAPPLWPVISLGFTPTRLYALKSEAIEIYSIH